MFTPLHNNQLYFTRVTLYSISTEELVALNPKTITRMKYHYAGITGQSFFYSWCFTKAFPTQDIRLPHFTTRPGYKLAKTWLPTTMNIVSYLLRWIVCTVSILTCNQHRPVYFGLNIYLFIMLIGHFTVVCLVTCPWIGSEAGGDLALIQTSLLFICKYKLVSIRTAVKSSEVCIKTRSPPASLWIQGQVT